MKADSDVGAAVKGPLPNTGLVDSGSEFVFADSMNEPKIGGPFAVPNATVGTAVTSGAFDTAGADTAAGAVVNPKVGNALGLG